MATAEEVDYQQVLTEHLFLFSKYIVADDFVDRLISDNILSLDDKDVILNPFANQSRRQRAVKLIEVLYTRGVKGYNKFLEILEYQYPHVYKEVTKKEPRQPPAGFRCNRTSDQLLLISDLPRLAQHIKDQHLQNADLQEELTVLQGLLELAKEENAALERDIDSLKHLKPKNEELMIRLSNIENDNRELQTTLNKEMQRTFKYIEERDEYQEKYQNLQIQYDELYKKFKEVESQKLTGRGSSYQEPAKPDAKTTSEIIGKRTEHTMAQLQILRDELEGYKNHAEDLAHRLHKAEENVEVLENNLKSRTKELHKQMEANRKDKRRLLEVNTTLENYCKLMHAKEADIIELNNQKILEQQKVTKLTQEKNDIFWAKHMLEKERDELKMELDRIKARNSGSSQEFSFQNSGSDDDPVMRSADEADDDEQVHHPFFDRHCKRRKFFKKRSIPGRYGNRHEVTGAACNTNLTNFSTMADIDSTEIFKASTLPVGSETPEMVFEREIAYLRYSKREHGRLQPQESMTTHPGSIHEKQQPSVRDPEFTPRPRPRGGDPHISLLQEKEDQSDKASDSTVYIARTTGQMPDSHLCSSLREEVDVLTDTDHASMSSGEFSLVDDFPTYDVKKDIIPKPCAQVTSTGAPDSSLYRTVLVKFPVLNDKVSDTKGAIELVGGNHTGIFVSKVLQKTVDLSEGEEIKEIVYTPTEKAKPVETTLLGCTLEQAHTLLSEEYIRPRKEREVKLKVRKCRLEYDSACKWMAENQGTGDFLFIRCNVNMEPRADDSVTPQAGEIFQVKNSRYNKKQWLGYRVNESTGQTDKTEIKIPNRQEASLRRIPSVQGRRMSEDKAQDVLRRTAVRVKGTTYERVLPMKATVKLPVYIVGPQQVVNGLLDLIAKKMSSEFIVQSSDGTGFDEHSELRRNDIHMVKRCSLERLQSMKAYQRILVFVSVTKEINPDMCSNIFGEAVSCRIDADVVNNCKSLRQKLTEGGHKFEELCLPDISTSEKLLETFGKCVRCTQTCTVWMSSAEMDEILANQYQRYLGQNCDLITIMVAIQRAQSLDHGSPENT